MKRSYSTPRELEIISVELCTSLDDKNGAALRYDYEKEQDKLLVYLPERVEPGTRFLVRTRTLCVPSR